MTKQSGADGVVVMDNRRGRVAGICPSTRFYSFESIDEAKDEFPTAVHREDLSIGDPLNIAVIFPEGE